MVESTMYLIFYLCDTRDNERINVLIKAGGIAEQILNCIEYSSSTPYIANSNSV